MSPQGCLAAFFLILLVLWSLMIGGLLTAGWLGAGIIELVVAAVFADAQAARQTADSLVQGLRALGFGVFAAIWAIGAGIISLLWFGLSRGARHAEHVVVETETIDITVDNAPAPHAMKDVTPRREGLPPPTRTPD
ncbi:MAG: hypothetical protein JNK67_21155 [Alphaproteobacteria bacterium]|nr:hypothetical protein [Alphaproteobacteria bacterium]